jgi:two-component system, cell cycle sensor histidine kinase and response regulator CckA
MNRRADAASDQDTRDGGGGRVSSDPLTEAVRPRQTVLVVEDEEMVRLLAVRMLSGLGYRAVQAQDGHQAIRLLQGGVSRIHAVLTDVAMPGIGGRQLGETIARCWPQVRVLYMSGFAAHRMVREGALDPSRPFIQKPFTSEELGRKVRQLFADPITQ